MVPFGRTAAIFDVDDSLLDGNAGTIFTWYLYSEKVMRPEMRSRIPRIIYEYARHRLTEQDMVEVGSRCQQGLYADELRAHAHRCFERHLRKRITSGAIRQIRKHLLSGHFVRDRLRLVAVHRGRGGAPPPRARGDRARARASWTGRATDQIVPPVVFRDGQARRGRGARGASSTSTSAKSFLYSDSSADVPLFEGVGNPVVVNPKAAFREVARRRGWEIVEWKERNRPGAEPDLADEWGSWGG